ncbi:MAG: ABC transporter ATP-binding protein, partial [Clostridia bacterium]
QIEENGKNLSTGERQLISLARCMYKGGEIFVWNETTSLLDAQTQATMNKIINKMTEDKTLLIIAHRPATIKTCNRILNVTTDGVKEIKEV